MKISRQTIAMAIGAAIVLSVPVAKATNITIEDNNTGSIIEGVLVPEVVSGWYKGAVNAGAIGEYQEVEPGMIEGAVWDLAAFVTPTAGALGVLSGYDLQNGQDGILIGDIFVDVGTGAMPYPDPNFPHDQFVSNSDFGYDYAVRFNFGANTYTVFTLTGDSILENGIFAGAGNGFYNSASMPWRLSSGATELYTGALNYTDNLANATADAYAGFDVDTDYKYYAEIGTGWLAPYVASGQSVLYHLTQACGNDNLIGIQSSGFQLKQVPDGSATLSLLGLSVLAFVGLTNLRSRWGRKAA